MAVNGQAAPTVSRGPLPSGEVVCYDAVVSERRTNASPPLPPLSHQFSVAASGTG